ncbi:MAG: molybdenum cofactor guanylyltransferase [Hydrotalea sp. AMD]|uniref:molybdenum cofactor guanylyltransferase n=1 Tax=Hydrotalea TaxID=1004300 RepID=UPI000944E3EE|nr:MULTISPECIES: molybdenum cofactor guanylyltransferase [Hydrotalea]RWZ86609.1 MAG: molybdenum cofactor guanylyltransferase [Hydrotalea sp. AMD]
MNGVILCGGQSTRMGNDKGMISIDDRTWVQAASEKLSLLGIPVLISVNKSQQEKYKIYFSSERLITDNNSLLVKGPLLGLLSVHLQRPSDDFFVFACDMPFMEFSLIKNLYCQYQQNSTNTFDAYIYTIEGEAEPLCGIYTAKALEFVMQMYYTGQLLKHSMKFILEHLSVYKIPVSADKKICFRNMNAHADLNGL